MVRQSYEDIIEQLKEVDSWLVAQGISGQHNRIHIHIANIRKLLDARADGTLRNLAEGIGQAQLMWSLVEALEFAEAYAALRDYDPGPLRQKLQDALCGPVEPFAETSSTNLGRNTMFELSLAGRLRSKGIAVHSLTNPDILCEIGQASLYIQCKRPFAEAGISRNISSARRQLTRDLIVSGSSLARGLVAISISRVLNPGDKLLVARTEGEVALSLADEAESLGQRHSHLWKRISDKRIVGILFHVMTPAFIEEGSILTAAEQAVVFGLPTITDADRELLRGFSHLLVGQTH
jgi:hypothetical protein